jgi:glycosyltransferase involved in cell wall biosynthesis
LENIKPYIEKMNIVILTEASFPFGMGATNRIISYSRGWVENKHRINVLCLKPTENSNGKIQNKNVKGSYSGISYEYCPLTSIKPKSVVKKIFLTFVSLLIATLRIFKLNKKEKIDSFILVSNSIIHILYFYVISKIFGIKYIQEKSEFPFVLRNRSLLGRIYSFLYTSYIYKLFDGIFVMTGPLREYFEGRIRHNAKLTIIPMTVETDRFCNYADSNNKEKRRYIAYCGDMRGNKDGVEVLIEAFSLIEKKYPELMLYLIGDSSNSQEFEKIKEKVAHYGLIEKVVFTGRLKREEMPEYLCHATLLALARPSSLQSEGGFPTKLGEYLSTGKPVIATKVGEIPHFLQDGINAFLSDPDSSEAFAAKIDCALSDYERAISIGKAGQGIARSIFDYRVQSEKLLEFIKSV